MARGRVKKMSSDAALAEHKKRGERFEFLRQRLRNVDVEEVWTRLEDELTLGTKRGDPLTVLRALDQAEDCARRAGMILQVAIEELDEFLVHWRAAYGSWAWEARETLEGARKKKLMSGTITQDMVEDWVAAHVPDYARWREARRDLERNKNLAKVLFESWQSRSASLRKQADLVERRRGVSTDMLPRRGEGDENHGD